MGITVGSRGKLEEMVCDKKRRIEKEDNEEENKYKHTTTVTKSTIVSFLMTWLIARSLQYRSDKQIHRKLRKSNQFITLATTHCMLITPTAAETKSNNVSINSQFITTFRCVRFE